MARKGEVIDIDVEGVLVTRSPDGQHRVLIEILGPMFDGPASSTTYKKGRVEKICAQRPTGSRAKLIGATISAHPGVRLVMLQSTRGAYVNLALDHPGLKVLLRKISREMLQFSAEFQKMLQRRAKLLEILDN